MTVLLAIGIFLLGMLAGATVVIAAALRMAKKSLKEKKVAAEKFLEELNKLTDNVVKKASSVDERLTRVKEIVHEQLDLQSQAEGPQRNSMDGKYKNSMMRTIKSLEEEKHQILRSIITDGFDPKVTVMGPDGVVTDMNLSEFMAQSGIDVPPPTKGTNKEGATRSGKFMVYKGGKNDGEGTSH